MQVDSEKDFSGWSWSKESKLHEILGMDGNMALMFQMVDHFLKEIFPPSILGQLKPYFDSANHVLDVDDRQKQRPDSLVVAGFW